LTIIAAKNGANESSVEYRKIMAYELRKGRRRESGGAQVAERMWQRPSGRPRVAWRSEGLPPAACPARHGVRMKKFPCNQGFIDLLQKAGRESGGLEEKKP